MQEDRTSTEIHFPHGLPGFEDQDRFVLVEREALAPVILLQSATKPDLRFLTISVWLADPGYQIGITEEDLKSLELEDQPKPNGEILCLAILTALDGKYFTANLLAPVVIHPRIHIGIQAVRTDNLYSHQFPLGAACS
jgi:flagellar assembly factor FliW